MAASTRCAGSASSGVWEIFVPVARLGHRYKFELRSRSGEILIKADPFGFEFEVPPLSASIVCSPAHEWQRRRLDGSPRRCRIVVRAADGDLRGASRLVGARRREAIGYLTYRELAERLIPYVKDMGYTHIELLPVMEHPYSASWGYQVTGFFAPTSRFGTPSDFKAFVDACHQHDIGVILDWVPGHFPKDAHGLAQFDGTALFEHADPRQGEHRDWGTLIFNYGRTEVRSFLLANALFWLQEYHADGLRVDAVASMLYLDYSRNHGEWVPNRFGGRENLEAIDFIRQLNTQTHAEAAGSITIAEESTAWPSVSRPTWIGGLGFTYKWNMGWMNDILQYVKTDPGLSQVGPSPPHVLDALRLQRELHPAVLTRRSRARQGLDVRQGAGRPLAEGGDAARALRLHVRASGQEADVHGRRVRAGRASGTTIARLEWELTNQPLHGGLQRFVRDLNRIYAAEPALHEIDFDFSGFQWIDCNDSENSVVSFIRRAKSADDFVVAVLNFTPVPRDSYRIGVPDAGTYTEIVNSDAELLRRRQRRQRRQRRDRADRHTWLPAVDQSAPAAARVFAAQAGVGLAQDESQSRSLQRSTNTR